MHLTDTHRDAYNRLLEVSTADDLLSRLEKDDHIDALLGVISRHSLQEKYGIRLLHRHNDIGVGEVMLADTLCDELGFAVVSQATIVVAEDDDIHVSSWQLLDGEFIPSEFSRRHVIVDEASNCSVEATMFSELAMEINQRGLNDLLGPCLNMSGWATSHACDADAILLERTNYLQRANVSRFTKASEVEKIMSRETTWQLTTHTAESSSDDEDRKKNLGKKQTKSCKCACSVSTSGGHLGTHVYLGH